MRQSRGTDQNGKAAGVPTQAGIAHILRPCVRQRQLFNRNVFEPAPLGKQNFGGTLPRSGHDVLRQRKPDTGFHQPVLRHRNQRLCCDSCKNRALGCGKPDDERDGENSARPAGISAAENERIHRRGQRPASGLGERGSQK